MTPVLAFDIETVPDIEGLRKLYALSAAVADAEVAEMAFQRRRQAVGHDFLPLHQHRVVAIACALRERDGFRVWSLGEAAESEGQLADRLLFYTKPKLLVIDELGYLPFERRSAHLFFQLVARRYERGSLLITTNQLVTQWGTVFGDEVLAAAILDRLLHHSHTLMIQGDSYRLKQKRKAGLIPAVPHPQGALAGEPARADRRKH